MRILHTADWHFGKTIEGRDRLPEQTAFVEELCAICTQERVDLVLVAGDVFQSPNPSAAAEELFYYAMDKLSDNGRRGIVIVAGNHDNPERLCAASPLAGRLGITLAGLPKEELSATGPVAGRVYRVNGGQAWLELAVPGVDYTAVIAALPYPSEGRLKEILSQSLEDKDLRQGYNDRLTSLFSLLNTQFRLDTVNLAISHVYVRGGIESDSEQQIQIGGAYAVDPLVFPAAAQYVALGHLHRPQYVGGTLMPCRYAGSPLAYSFSEIGQAKSVTLIDVRPGKKPDIYEVPVTAGRPLARWRATGGLRQVREWVAAGRDKDAWIEVELEIDKGLTLDEIQELRALHTGFVTIRPVISLTVSESEAEKIRLNSLPLNELFIRFYKQQNGGLAPDSKLVELFLDISQDLLGEKKAAEGEQE
ncbi:exonuclease SbcCD subunit D [Sporomusa acidovorans]|uniref:Nuclease SbcCD subunit D n=1 Tax=Sporomusa acidovorans (strain ATCC 49682 / DSM 3132 / Mol) TaxID=1123286 RepID=A0ABZ3IW93_SPOA4|nr:exonuclease SbcCD subunit D [Sporomusa acidovorans]OZC15289.1 nuclease SbcCD subunit D [Sporomusa acidovorans DSM 3132]SDE92144.1 Exodeoxyribonuclease I subunit D [Sporomusa acidovorans]